MYGAIKIQFPFFAHFCKGMASLRHPLLPGALVFCATWIPGREGTVHVHIPNVSTGVNYQYQNDSEKWSLEMELANRQTDANPYHGFPFYKTAFWKVIRWTKNSLSHYSDSHEKWHGKSVYFHSYALSLSRPLSLSLFDKQITFCFDTSWSLTSIISIKHRKIAANSLEFNFFLTSIFVVLKVS